MSKMSWCAGLGLALLGTAVVSADTLVLRDGRRLDGELVAVNDGAIEFREGRSRTRLLRLDREEVLAIEFSGSGRGQTGFAPGQDSVRPRPRGMREKDVTVSGDVPFVDTGIDVRPGQQIYFESTGNVWWKPGERTGPAGEAGSDSKRDERRPMPRRATGALIGKVGQDSSDLFFIGADPGPMRLREAGRLFLGVNDDNVQDNRGNFRVVVYY
jgi:hypothetical protein